MAVTFVFIQSFFFVDAFLDDGFKKVFEYLVAVDSLFGTAFDVKIAAILTEISHCLPTYHPLIF